MSNSLEIFKITKNDKGKTVYEEIVSAKGINTLIHLTDKCEGSGNWFISDINGFIGEIGGSDLLDYLLSETNVNTDFIEEDEVYRIEVGY